MSLKLAGSPTRAALLRVTASYTSGSTSQRLRSSPGRADLHPPSLLKKKTQIQYGQTVREHKVTLTYLPIPIYSKCRRRPRCQGTSRAGTHPAVLVCSSRCPASRA